MVVAFLLLGGGLLAWAFLRGARLFTLSVEGGRIVRVQGHLPPRLLSELRDVVERARLPRARLVAVARDGLPALTSDAPLSEGLEQQLRNVLGQFSVAQIRRGTRH
jgi:hypothetical protein